MPDSSNMSDLDLSTLQPSSQDQGNGGQEMTASLHDMPNSTPINSEFNVRGPVEVPLVQRPLYNPSTARANPQPVQDSTQPAAVPASATQFQPASNPYAAPQPVQIATPPAAEQRETIQIAPHPTTNRYPWAPVENPSVPVPAATDMAGQSNALPVMEPQPAAAPVNIYPPPPPPATPEPLPTPAPVPDAVPDLPPIAPPQIFAEPTPAPPVEPVQAAVDQPAPDLLPFPAAPSAEPVVSAPPQPPLHLRKKGKPVKIYSEYTKEVWHVFKPSKIMKLFLIGFLVIVVVSAVIFWQSIGAPTNVLDIPFLQPLLKAE